MAWNRRALVTAVLALPLAACVKQAPPDPAEIRETAPRIDRLREVGHVVVRASAAS